MVDHVRPNPVPKGFGYAISVRHSKYRWGHDPRGVMSVPLERALLTCRTHNWHRCRSAMTVMTTVELQNQDRSVRSGGQWRYCCDMERAFHNHEPDCKAFLKCLPPVTTKQALKMHNELKMSYNDVLIYLKDRCNIKSNREVLRQQLRYMRSTTSPRDQDCFRLCHCLFEMQANDPSHKVFFRTTGKGKMHSTAWMLWQLVDDCNMYGTIPGVSIDCKAMANLFGYLLFSMNWRTSAWDVCTFFMVFVPWETKESLKWMSQKFKSAIRVSPATVIVDQNVALIAAGRSVFPNRFITLDERHLNMNQLTNTRAWCSKLGSPAMAKQMSDDLHSLRRIERFESFYAGGDEFEQI